jgi:hypothetical protein
VLECVEQPCHLLAALVRFLSRGDRFATIRLTGDHGFHALLMQHLPHRIAGLGLLPDGGVQRGEGRSVVPHPREARCIMLCPTGQD